VSSSRPQIPQFAKNPSGLRQGACVGGRETAHSCFYVQTWVMEGRTAVNPSWCLLGVSLPLGVWPVSCIEPGRRGAGVFFHSVVEGAGWGVVCTLPGPPKCVMSQMAAMAHYSLLPLTSCYCLCWPGLKQKGLLFRTCSLYPCLDAF
jgi:hypothetical protein